MDTQETVPASAGRGHGRRAVRLGPAAAMSLISGFQPGSWTPATRLLTPPQGTVPSLEHLPALLSQQP